MAARGRWRADADRLSPGLAARVQWLKMHSCKPIHLRSRRRGGHGALGAALAEILPDGATVALVGTLGAGKTRLVQAIAEAAGVEPPQRRQPHFRPRPGILGPPHDRHIDAYRLRDEAEFRDLGPDEFFEGGALVLVEWADRVENCLPRERIEIHIAATGPQSRRFEIRAVGQRDVRAIDALAARLWPKQ